MTYKEQKAKYAVRPTPDECRELFELAIEAYEGWDNREPLPTLTDSNGNTHTLAALCGFMWLNKDIMRNSLIRRFAEVSEDLCFAPSHPATTYAAAARRLRQLIAETVDGDIREDFGLKPSIPLTVGARLH